MNIAVHRHLALAALLALARLGAFRVGLAVLLSPLTARADATYDPAAATAADLIPGAAFLSIPGYELDHALLPATHDDALPDGYVPPDLVGLAQFGIPQRGAQQVREVVVPDLWAMVEAAHQEHIQLWVLSSYRSYAVQTYTYNGYVRQWGQQVADQRSARPGHSQHQLGTAIDFNQLSPAFLVGPEGRWLWQHAHEYGFVFPYTRSSVARTGYIFEPWHVRWVGRDLAQVMWDAGYLDSTDLTADDYVAAARAALASFEF